MSAGVLADIDPGVATILGAAGGALLALFGGVIVRRWEQRRTTRARIYTTAIPQAIYALEGHIIDAPQGSRYSPGVTQHVVRVTAEALACSRRDEKAARPLAAADSVAASQDANATVNDRVRYAGLVLAGLHRYREWLQDRLLFAPFPRVQRFVRRQRRG